MKTVGLITEYNPFHRGHLYHLENSKFLTKSEYSISIMSGNFLQRGEPAMLDKFHRAKMAVQNGVDLVVELPFAYACQTAELFAFGSVKTLDAFNSVDCISFGSEAGSLEHLERISEILISEPPEFKSRLKSLLGDGLSFPKARELALIDYLQSYDDSDDIGTLSDIISSSNNILGIEYIKAIKKLNSSIKPFTIERISSKYNDKDLRSEISSATAIRNTFFESGRLDSVASAVPEASYSVMEEFLSHHTTFNCLENFSDILFYLLTVSNGDLEKRIMDMDYDLSNRLLKALKKSNSLEELLQNTKTKRYAMARIKRGLMHLLLGLYSDDIERFLNSDTQYLRVLGANKKGFEILNKVKSNSDICIINKISDAKSISDPVALKMLSLDIKSSDIYSLGLHKHSGRLNKDMDYLTTPYIEK